MEKEMNDVKDSILGKKKLNKKRGQGVWVAVGIIALVVIAFIFGMFGPEGGAVDKENLGGRISGTWGDFLGIPMFLGAIAYMVYLWFGKEPVTNVEGEKLNNTIPYLMVAAGVVGGFLLFWHQ